jgi:DNA-binding PadR family transcriptional regulator
MDPEDLLPLPQAVFHIMVSLAEGERHGYAIMQEVAARTEGKLRLGPGTLYGSIKRMLEDGLIAEHEPRAASGDERRRYYRLTAFGRRVASAETARLESLYKQARAAGLAAAISTRRA